MEDIKKERRKIEFFSPEEMFGVQDMNVSEPEEDIVIKLDDIHDFHTKIIDEGPTHPFRRVGKPKHEELKSSILHDGLLQPLIVRADETGYELIAGHNRRDALIELGWKTLSLQKGEVKIVDCDDPTAVLCMTGSNIQRDEFLASERAWEYRLKTEALVQTRKSDEMVFQDDRRTDEIIADEAGTSRANVQRYIRLTYLPKELLDMVDADDLPVNVGYEISFLETEEQQEILKAITQTKVPSLAQMKKIRELCAEQFCSSAVIAEIISPIKEERYVDFKPVFKSVEKQFNKVDIAIADKIDKNELSQVMANAAQEYLNKLTDN